MVPAPKWLAKSSLLLPRLPIWELVVLFYLFIYASSAILTQRGSPTIESLIGTSIGYTIWYGGILVVCIIWIVSLLLPPQHGINLNLAAMILLFLLAFSVAIGLAIDRETVFFSGNSGLWIFAAASFTQIIYLLWVLRKARQDICRG